MTKILLTFALLLSFAGAAVPPPPVMSWGVDRVDQRDLPLDGLYESVSSGTGVDVYIVDSGINYTHREFGGRAKPFYDAIGDGRNGGDCDGHGTHVAGIVGGTTFGVARNTTLYSARVLDCNGDGSIANIVEAINRINSKYAAAKGRLRRPTVVNISITAGGQSPWMEDAINQGVALGIVYVVAAGNAADNACFYSPAGLPSVITVGATADDDARWLGSNYGSCVDVFAPGLYITSAGVGSDTSAVVKSGTSMASPHVAGAAALYLETHRRASPFDVANAIQTGAAAGRITNPGLGSPNLLLYTNTLQ